MSGFHQRRRTYADYEVILIDDGSLDASGSICDAYVEQDNRFKVIHKENGGAGSHQKYRACCCCW